MLKINNILIASAILATYIHANTNELQISIFSATKSEQSIIDITSDVEVITAAQLESMQITSVNDALKLTGISLTNSGGLGQQSSFFMNGMSAEHTLVMIDGIRYNDPTVTNGYALLEQLLITDIKRIEIINGAQSGIWGSNAASGVINIITKEASNKINAKVNLEVGSFKSKKINIILQGKDDKESIKMSLSNINSDSFTAMALKGKNIHDYENDSYKNTTVNFQYSYRINETNKISFLQTIIDASGDYDSNFSGKANDRTSTHSTNNKLTTIKFNHVDSFNIFDIYWNESIFNRQYAQGEYEGSIKEIAVKSKIPYNKNDFVQIGFDTKKQVMTKSYSKLYGKYDSKGVFITNSNKFNAMTGGINILTQSIRFDDYDKFEDKATGKIGLKHFHDSIKGFTTSLNYGTAYKTPSLFNLYSLYAGNENLIPETIKSLDVTMQYKDLKIKYYKSTIDDEILYSNITDKYEQSNKQSKYSGYEISYKKSINKILLSLKYLNEKAQDKNGNDLPRRVKEKSIFSVDYFGIKKFNFNLNGEYIGSRFDDIEKKIQTGKYTVLNTVVNYDINKNVKTYLKIDNLNDKKYQTVDGYTTSPRAYYFGINAKF